MQTKKKSFVNAIIISFVVYALAVLSLFYGEWRQGITPTFEYIRGFIYKLPLFFVLSVLGHMYEGSDFSMPGYLKKLFIGTKQERDRLLYLDYVRVLAAFLVILTHACSFQIGAEGVEQWKMGLISVLSSLALVCNPLYIMLSGVLLLSDKKDETLLQFYKNRFIKVVVPFFCYYTVIMFFGGNIVTNDSSTYMTSIKTMLAGSIPNAPHYWIMFVFFTLYLVSPFIKKMVQSLSDRQATELTVLILISELIVTYLPYTGIALGMEFIFAGWLGVYMLGYLLLVRENVILNRIIIILGIASAVVISVVSVVDYARAASLYNTSPVMVLFAAAIMILLKRGEANYHKTGHPVLLALSKYSFPMLLIHWHMLFAFTVNRFFISPLRFGCIGGIVITMLVTVIICFIAGFFMENTLVIAVQYILIKLTGLFKKSSKG